MKKYLLPIMALLPLCATTSKAQSPFDINSKYINQTSTLNPNGGYSDLYQVWRYNGSEVGTFGYVSNTSALFLYNVIGDLQFVSNSATGSHWFNINGSRVMHLAANGRVSIGRDDARYTLDVEGNAGVRHTLWIKSDLAHSSELILEKPDQTYYSIGVNANSMNFYNHSTEKVFLKVDANDNIGIGTPDTYGYKLAVAGGILTEKVKVKSVSNWPDYVFAPNYKVRSLAELESYINTHQHLPGIPSAQEVEENGIDLAKNQAALLEKIEELTLIIIEQNKKLEAQEKRLQALENK